ncbi:MAG: CHAD domain-containing protein [Nitriliruptor sp.]|nr:MAG: CHAD domain-containing protein [Nitriliruptor sp.]
MVAASRSVQASPDDRATLPVRPPLVRSGLVRSRTANDGGVSVARYRWRPGNAAEDELRRIAAGQVESALDDLADDDRHRAVHSARKRGKKLRALLRLVRGSAPDLYRRENRALRDAMRRLSDDRDAGVAVETFDDLLSSVGADAIPTDLAPVRAALVERRDAVLDAELDQRLAAVQADLAAARDRIGGWEGDGEGFEVVQGGLAKTYGRARDRMDDAYEEATSEAFHLWRKRVKYHRYHVRLLQDLWPGMLRARRKQLHELTDLLGDDHDLSVLRQDLVAEPDRYGGVEGVASLAALLDRRRAELQAAAEPLGRRCFAEPPDAFVARLRTYWEVAAADQDVGPLADATVPAGR